MKKIGKTKRKHYSILNERNALGNRKFWKTMKPMVPSKFISSEKNTLVENEMIITDDREIVELLNDFFLNIIEIFNVP